MLDRWNGRLWDLATARDGETVIYTRSLKKISAELCQGRLHGFDVLDFPATHSTLKELRVSLVGAALRGAGSKMSWEYLSGLFGRCKNTLKSYLKEAGVDITRGYYVSSNRIPDPQKPTFSIGTTEFHSAPNTIGVRSVNKSLNRRLNKGRVNYAARRPDMTVEALTMSGLSNVYFYRVVGMEAAQF